MNIGHVEYLALYARFLVHLPFSGSICSLSGIYKSTRDTPRFRSVFGAN